VHAFAPLSSIAPHLTTEPIDKLFFGVVDDESLAVIVVAVATLLVAAAADLEPATLLLLLLLRLVEEAKARGREAHCWAREAMVFA
jgi:energy-converting hydrogenase Eha subunit C